MRPVNADPSMPLLWYVRDLLQLTGTKYGCGKGLCGACTVHIDGVAVRSCVIQIGSLKNKKITTIEALAETHAHPLHPVQKAWVDADVSQCGFCQSGQIMQAASLLAENPGPTSEEIDLAMSGNLCRCGTYTRIRTAIKNAANIVEDAQK